MKIKQQKPVTDEAEACIGRIVKLCQFLERRPHADGAISVEAHETGRDEATLRIHPDTFVVILYSCQTSHHNGDSYDGKNRTLTGDERLEKLKQAETKLFGFACSKYKVDEERRKREEEALRFDNAVRRAVFGDD